MALSPPGDHPWTPNGSVGSSTTTSSEVGGGRERAWTGPRTIHLQKCERGFGFTLRHFIVYPPPDANKLQQLDGDGTKLDSVVGAMDTIFVKHVKEGSPAQRAGLNTGDRIISVNGESIAGKSYAQVIQLIQRSGNVLQLRVVPKEDDILQLYFPGTAYRSIPTDMSRVSIASGSSSSSNQPPSSLPIQSDGSIDPHHQPSPSELGRRRYSELPSLFQPASLVPGSSASGSTWSVSNAGLGYGSSGDRSRSSSDLSPASSSSSSSLMASRPLVAYHSYLRPWPPKSNFNVLIQPCPPATEYVTSSTGHYSSPAASLSETGVMLNASAPSSVTSSREASIERPDVNDSIINRLRASFEKKEEFLLRTGPGPCVVPQRLFNVAAVSGSGGSTTGNDSAISSSASSPTQVTTSATGVGGVSSTHFSYVTPVRTLMGIELEETPPPPRPVIKPQVPEEKPNVDTQPQPNVNGKQLRKAASLDSGNQLPQAAVPLKPHPGSTGTGSAGSIVVDPNGSQGIHLVSQRAKLFETGTLEQEANNRMKLYKNELARMTTRGQTPRVSDRAAQFESLSTSQETIGSESDYSSSPRQKPNKGDVVGQMMRSATEAKLRANLAGNAAGNDPSTNAVPGVRLRRKEDGDTRATRRISYLKATSGDDGRVGVNFPFGEEEEDEEQQEEDEETEEECTTSPSNSSSSQQTVINVEVKNASSGTSKVQSIQKLKSFFGEKTPQIVHAAADRGRRFRDFPAVSSLLLPSTSAPLVKEGWLHCKVAFVDGKRATDRSWKQLWAILKGHTLHLYKDRKDAFQHQSAEEHPIDLLRCRLEPAHDYTKKKHVFRIVTACGSEYLFQAETKEDMQRWMRDIQHAVEANEMCVISQGIVQKKSAMFEREISQHGNTAVPGSKGIRKLAPFRSRSPTGHSPTSKARKSSHAEDASPKSKTWRGKMVKTIRKIHGIPPASGVACGFTIGIPLEECPSSAENEFVPLLVELCTSIVEARGMDTVGVYRVPGNTASVSYLMEAVDRGFDSINLQDPRWRDVNVISSVLKAFFRKLPEPLVTGELYPGFIEASKCDDHDRRMYEIKRMLHQLPDCNYETLKFLVRHLQRIAKNSEVNRMEARNIAIVFGPTLIRASDDNMLTMVNDMSFQCRIVETLVKYGDWFFSSNENEDISNRYFRGREVNEDAPLPNANLLLLNNVIKMEHAQAEMRPKEVSAKDLVTSIIGAANRKVKQKMRRHVIAHDDTPIVKNNSVEERDIDHEIALRLHRSGAAKTTVESNGEATVIESKHHRHDRRHSEDSTISSMSTRAPSEDYTCPRKMSVDSLDGLSTIPRGTGEKERAFCVVRPSSSSIKRSTWDGGSMGNTLSVPSPHPTQPHSLPAHPLPLPTEPNETGCDGGEHSVLKTYAGLSASMQERIRKFELETKALLQRDSSATKRDSQLDRQRIEAEWQRAKLDLEQDDFLDRLADNPSVAATTINTKMESTLPPSPPKSQRQPSAAQLQQHQSRRGDGPAPAPWPINPYRKPTSARSDMKRVNSVEGFGEKAVTRASAKGWASQRRKAISAEVPPGGEDPFLGQGPAKWCGSLDSLREFYELSKSSGWQDTGREVRMGRSSKSKGTRSSDIEPDQPYQPTSTVPSGGVTTRPGSDSRASKKSNSDANENVVPIEKSAEAGANKQEELTKGSEDETDVSFQRNENTLITATLSTTSNTIMTTTTTAVMTATIKSTKPILGHRGSDPTSLNGSIVAFREKRYESGNQKRLSSSGGGSKKGRGSPPPSSASQRKSSHLRSLKRRHTVGGTKDFEKFRLLVSGGGGSGGNGHGNQIELEIPAGGMVGNSAWERLRPAVPPEQRSMKSWLRMERLRTSSPELQQLLPVSVDVAPESLMDVDERKTVHGTSALPELQPESTSLPIPPALESQV